MHPFHPGVVRRLELTQAFETRSPWALVVTELPGEASTVAVSFVRQNNSQEHIKLFPGERSFYTLLESRIVYSKPEERAPLLLIRACTLRYGNCSCWISTLLYAYDRESDSFRTVFFGLTASDAKQATRFIDSGPLLGRVVVVTPTSGAAGAAFSRVVEVYKRSVIGEYLRVLVYCSGSGCCGDTDSASVIDSEMPEIFRRLGMDQMSALAT
ncbi:hypothetical protein ACFJGW_08255 [Burkholderiaceae bacterium UC74_6]